VLDRKGAIYRITPTEPSMALQDLTQIGWNILPVAVTELREDDEPQPFWRRWTEWAWRLLPDRCEMDGCLRLGVRGKETRIDGKFVCDYCHVKLRLGDHDRIDDAS